MNYKQNQEIVRDILSSLEARFREAAFLEPAFLKFPHLDQKTLADIYGKRLTPVLEPIFSCRVETHRTEHSFLHPLPDIHVLSHSSRVAMAPALHIYRIHIKDRNKKVPIKSKNFFIGITLPTLFWCIADGPKTEKVNGHRFDCMPTVAHLDAKVESEMMRVIQRRELCDVSWRFYVKPDPGAWRRTPWRKIGNISRKIERSRSGKRDCLDYPSKPKGQGEWRMAETFCGILHNMCNPETRLALMDCTFLNPLQRTSYRIDVRMKSNLVKVRNCC